MGNNITQKLKYKESVVKFSYKYGVTKAAIKFCECRRTIYRWRKRYDGTLKSLEDKSRRPHYHPNQHTEQEIKMIKNYKNNKYVPKACMSPELQERGEKFYQYTAIDEYTRLRYTWFTNEHSTYMSNEFLKRLIRYFPFKIRTIQTDNGFEFTNRLSWQAFLKNKKTLFEKTLEELKIEYKVIKPHTPKQNGRVERSHRKDQERFYYKRVFCSLEDLRNRGADWRKEYNNFPMRPLGWLSPNDFLKRYKSQGESVVTI